MNKALVESLKELARVVVIAIIPVLITSLEAGTLDVKSTGVALAIAVLRAIDKFSYEQNKTSESKSVVKVPF